VPQSTPTEGACIIIEEPAESASSMATSPGNLNVSSQDASTQCCVGAKFLITRSEYTQTDPVVSTPVTQQVKTFTDTGTQVEIIKESPDGANPGPSGHSSHAKDEKEKIVREFTLAFDLLIAINLTKRNKDRKKI